MSPQVVEANAGAAPLREGWASPEPRLALARQLQAAAGVEAQPAQAPAPLSNPLAPVHHQPLLTGVRSPGPRQTFAKLPAAANIARVRTLHQNNEAWLALWALAGSAKQIDASYFCFDRDVFGHAMLGMMLRRRLEGAPVNLLVDASGDAFGRTGFTMPWSGREYLEALAYSGAKVGIYNPFLRKIGDQLLHPGSTRLAASNHVKGIATERYAMTGGRNVASDYFSSPRDRKGVYYDADIVVDGAAAAAELRDTVRVEADNAELVQSVKPGLLSRPQTHYAELLGSAAMMDAWLAREPFTEAEKAQLRGSAADRAQLLEPLTAAALADLKVRGITVDAASAGELRKRALELVSNVDLAGAGRTFRMGDGMMSARVKTLTRTSSAAGANGFDQVTPGLMKLIDSASGPGARIVITNQYLVLTQEMRRHIEAASARGVRIDVLTNSPHSSDDQLTQAFLMRSWPRLLASCPTMHLYVLDGDEHMHVKSMEVSGQVAVVGSYNLDFLSSAVNSETVEVAQSREVAARLIHQFDIDRADPTKHVVEYTIAKDAHGKAVLRNGEPIVTFGPENHIPAKEMSHMWLWKALSHALELLPQAASLRQDHHELSSIADR